MINYLLSAIIFVILDGIYINSIKNYFNTQITNVQGTPVKIKLIPTALTYVFLIFILEYFIISKKQNYKNAFLLGLSIYAVYELTNYSLFSKWSLLTVFIDTFWGGIVFALTTFLTYKLTHFF
jgi:uncharacterized membrane protein